MSKNEINSDFIVVHSWMVKDLHLSGNELLIYSVIYGFSRDGCSSFYGSADYLADLTGMSRRSVFNCLKKLVSQNILIKNIFEQNNVVKTAYKANLHLVQNLHSGSAKSALEVVQNLHSGSAKSAPNNIYNKKEKHKIEDNKERVRAGNFSTDILTDAGITENVANDFVELRKRLKAPITQTAVNGLQMEAQKAGMTLEDVLITMCANGWRGFKADWVAIKNDVSHRSQKKTIYEQNREAGKRAKEMLFGVSHD